MAKDLCGGRTNRTGKPCKRVAVKDGRCGMHGADKEKARSGTKAQILEEMSDGEKTLYGVCGKLGISRSTVYRYMESDDGFDEQLKTIVHRNDKIRVQRVEDTMYQRIVDGKASAAEAIFYLVNRAPGRWKHVNRYEHTGKDGRPIEHRTAELSDNELEAIIFRDRLKPSPN